MTASRGAWCLTKAKAHELFSCQRVALQAPLSFTPRSRQVAGFHTGSYQLSELQLADAFQDLMKRRREEVSFHFQPEKVTEILVIRELFEIHSFSGENEI